MGKEEKRLRECKYNALLLICMVFNNIELTSQYTVTLCNMWGLSSVYTCIQSIIYNSKTFTVKPSETVSAYLPSSSASLPLPVSSALHMPSFPPLSSLTVFLILSFSALWWSDVIYTTEELQSTLNFAEMNLTEGRIKLLVQFIRKNTSFWYGLRPHTSIMFWSIFSE